MQTFALYLDGYQSDTEVGFDDLNFSPYLDPPLTTVRQPLRQMGRMAMETLLHIFDGPHSTHNLRVEGQMIVRQSTAPPREGAWHE